MQDFIKTALGADVKAKDAALWKEWKKTKSPLALQQLLNQMHPIIMQSVNKWAPAASRSLLESEAKRLAVDAFERYDPKQGAALSTFLASRLQKLSRTVYATQNVARLSETKALLVSTYNTALTELRDHYGREPTHIELADHLSWTPRKLDQFQRQVLRKEYVESEEHPEFVVGPEEHLEDFIYHDLTPLQQKIFEYLTGYRGAPKLTNQQIMSRLKLTQGQLSYQKNLMVKAAERALGKR